MCILRCVRSYGIRRWGGSVLITSTIISTQPFSSGLYLSSRGPHVFSYVFFSSWLRHSLACHTGVTYVRIARGAWPSRGKQFCPPLLCPLSSSRMDLSLLSFVASTFLFQLEVRMIGTLTGELVVLWWLDGAPQLLWQYCGRQRPSRGDPRGSDGPTSWEVSCAVRQSCQRTSTPSRALWLSVSFTRLVLLFWILYCHFGAGHARTAPRRCSVTGIRTLFRR